MVLSSTASGKVLKMLKQSAKAPVSNIFPGTAHVQDYITMLQSPSLLSATWLINDPQRVTETSTQFLDIINSWGAVFHVCEGLKTARGLCTFSPLWNLHMLLLSNLIKHRTEPVFVESLCISCFVLPLYAAGRLSCVAISIFISVSSISVTLPV